jgi:cyclic pyranopterin phosphate synthase
MYLRVSLTDRCNLRCTYCLPEAASFAATRIAPGEIQQLMAAVVAAGQVTKIRLTGGEPTLCPELVEHVRAARWLVPTVAMTSNGVLLRPLLPALKEAGLSRLNISLDAADPAGFAAATRRDRFPAVLGAIRAARDLGFAPLKLNAVATVDSDAAALVRLAVAERVHLRFIELMDIGEAHAGWAERQVSTATLLDRLAQAGLRLTPDLGRDEPTSRVHVLAGVDPELTTVGFITTVSDPFCATCDRIRLTSQGRLHTCLFDEVGTDLLAPLRRGALDELDAVIRRAIAAKAPAGTHRHAVMAGIGG